MSNPCLPRSLAKLCHSLSSLSIRGRVISHHASVSRLKPFTKATLPGSVPCTDLQKTGLIYAPASSANLPASLLCMRGETLSVKFNPSLVSSVNNRTNYQHIFHGNQHNGLGYICPSNITTSKTIIVDQAVCQNTVIDCPTLPGMFYEVIFPELRIHKVIDPVPGSGESGDKTPPAKEARRIMKIRRQKMNRHLLKKFRKRMAFTLKKQRLLMKKKKEAVFQAKLDAIRKSGEDFDALEFVRKELEIARKGGFQIDVFRSN